MVDYIGNCCFPLCVIQGYSYNTFLLYSVCAADLYCCLSNAEVQEGSAAMMNVED